ncbi:hypothetical protein RI065_08020 [Mycoplasmatota bacterium zrk1]
MKKYIVGGIVILLVAILFLLTNNRSTSIFTLRHLYSQALTDGEFLRIPLLVNNDSFYTDESSIERINLIDDTNIIPVSIDSISKDELSYYYGAEKYNVYMFDLVPEIGARVNLLDAKLEIIYLNGEVNRLSIGDINIINYSENKDLGITGLTGIINIIEGYETTVGFVMGIKNLTDSDIEIKGFNINANPVFVINKLIKEVENLEIDMFTSMEELIPEYHYLLDPTLNTSFIISANSKKNFIVPIVYEEIRYLNRFPIIIKYDDNEFIYDDFLFMNLGYFPEFLLETKRKYDMPN